MPDETTTRPLGINRGLAPFGVTIFTEMSRLAAERRAVNLSQGFPDFDGPGFVVEAAADALRAGHNQYARMFGVPPLTEALGASWRARTGLPIDPEREVTVTAGCTEALAATMLGLLEPGDEVILLEPFYDSYIACVRMAGATPRVVTLRPPPPGAPDDAPFTLDEGELRAAFGPRTRAIVVNTPHNPTGKVFAREELELIASLCIRHGAAAITDEVYERLTYDPARPHVSLATLPGMAERTVTLSSLGKTFSLTGWKIGWAIAPPALTAAVRAAHQFLTFCAATPLQHAAALALTDPRGEAAVQALARDFRARRDEMVAGLRRAGFGVRSPAGAYFVMADWTRFRGVSGAEDDRAFCRWLVNTHGVAAIPPSVFYADPARTPPLVRFAFCKCPETIAEGLRRLAALAG